MNIPTDMQPGHRHYTDTCGWIVIEKYYSKKEVLVEFEEYGYRKTLTASIIKTGGAKCPAKSTPITPRDMKFDTIHKTATTDKVRVLEYINPNEVHVQFIDTGMKGIYSVAVIRQGMITNIPSSYRGQKQRASAVIPEYKEIDVPVATKPLVILTWEDQVSIARHNLRRRVGLLKEAETKLITATREEQEARAEYNSVMKNCKHVKNDWLEMFVRNKVDVDLCTSKEIMKMLPEGHGLTINALGRAMQQGHGDWCIGRERSKQSKLWIVHNLSKYRSMKPKELESMYLAQ